MTVLQCNVLQCEAFLCCEDSSIMHRMIYNIRDIYFIGRTVLYCKACSMCCPKLLGMLCMVRLDQGIFLGLFYTVCVFNQIINK